MSVARQSALTHAPPPDVDREVHDQPLQFALISRVAGYMRRYAAKRNWLILAAFTRAVQLPLLAWALASVINGPIAGGDPPAAALGAAGFALLSWCTMGVLHFRQRYSLELGELVVRDLREELFEHLQRMPMSFYNSTKLGSIISRMISDVEAVRLGVQNVVFNTVVSGGQMLVAAILMLVYDPALFAIVAGIAPVIYGLNRVFRRRLSRVTRARAASLSRLTVTVAESVSGIRVTQGFSRQDVNAEIFGSLVADHSHHNLSVARTSGMFLPLMQSTSQAFVAVLLIVGGYRVLSPEIAMPVGNLIHFFFLATVFFQPVQGLAAQFNNALESMAGAERLFRMLDTEPEWVDEPTAEDLETVTGRVEFRGVDFAYTPGIPVLGNINFVAEPGQTIALVGHTGSGKTTIANLIAKFYLPTAGKLLIDGREIRDISGESLHLHMGVIQQENFVFTASVMDNIRFGRPGASDEEVREAARKLDCLDLLEALPQGLDTPVGERGSSLSLGQRQLVCFTRAMLADPQIFILDEATSSVDSMTEARIQKALEALLRGRTSFVVAHRLSTVRHADQVLVLDHGEIIERGSHEELLLHGEVYANLYRQFARAGEG